MPDPSFWQCLAGGYAVCAAPFAAYFVIAARRLHRDRKWSHARTIRFLGDAE